MSREVRACSSASNTCACGTSPRPPASTSCVARIEMPLYAKRKSLRVRRGTTRPIGASTTLRGRRAVGRMSASSRQPTIRAAPLAVLGCKAARPRTFALSQGPMCAPTCARFCRRARRHDGSPARRVQWWLSVKRQHARRLRPLRVRSFRQREERCRASHPTVWTRSWACRSPKRPWVICASRRPRPSHGPVLTRPRPTAPLVLRLWAHMRGWRGVVRATPARARRGSRRAAATLRTA